MISDGNPTDVLVAAKGEAQRLLQEAKFTADKIVAEGNRVSAAAVKAADDEARQVLQDAKVWVQEAKGAHKSPLFGWVSGTVCSADSKLGAFLDWMMGEAKSCYCCAAVRAGLIFGVTGFLLGIVLGHAL